MIPKYAEISIAMGDYIKCLGFEPSYVNAVKAREEEEVEVNYENIVVAGGSLLIFGGCVIYSLEKTGRFTKDDLIASTLATVSCTGLFIIRQIGIKIGRMRQATDEHIEHKNTLAQKFKDYRSLVVAFSSGKKGYLNDLLYEIGCLIFKKEIQAARKQEEIRAAAREREVKQTATE